MTREQLLQEHSGAEKENYQIYLFHKMICEKDIDDQEVITEMFENYKKDCLLVEN
jgi:hypothetical protein